jgi:ferritin-like metal-binding protein YciE
MADLNERDAKLVQYLSEAYGKERELETALQAHIAMTTRPPYKRRLQQHLRETKAHAKALERRIRRLGGGGQTVQTAVGKAMAAAKGPLHAIRGGSEQEKMLKNAKTEYFNEHEEIATYLAIEIFAEKVGDRETAKLARGIRREEERMARFLESTVRALTAAVAVEEVPRDQRNSGGRRRTARRSRPKAKARPRPKAGAKRSRATAKATPKRSRATAKAKATSKARARSKAGKR